MNNIAQLIGLSANASGKAYGIRYAETAENLYVNNGTISPRSGQHYLSQSNITQKNCFGIQPIKLSTAKYSAIVTVGSLDGTNSAIFIYRTPRRLRVGL